MLQDKKILLGVTGGIAAYKSAMLVGRLKEAGAQVFVVMTRNATRFVAPLTLQTLCGHPVYVEMFPPTTDEVAEHVSLGERADVVLVAPATANIIGKVAAGIGDDMLSTTIMASQAPVIFAPAMHAQMYRNPIVQENIARLAKLGYYFVGPAEGKLARGEMGVGRLAEIPDIVKKVEQMTSTQR
jgi:phosphopantothenoylcysteine decarboxylase/phosphopantothenate--cysteine ligase